MCQFNNSSRLKVHIDYLIVSALKTVRILLLLAMTASCNISEPSAMEDRPIQVLGCMTVDGSEITRRVPIDFEHKLAVWKENTEAVFHRFLSGKGANLSYIGTISYLTLKKTARQIFNFLVILTN